jgi:glutathione synthase
MGIGDFAYNPDGSLSPAPARAPARPTSRWSATWQGRAEARRRAAARLDEFDVVMLRFDPADDAESRTRGPTTPASPSGSSSRLAGVLVVNDPTSLANALSKAYFQHFPEVVRPKTLISRDEEQIEAFVKELGGKAVLKPLQGSGGSGVFLVNSKEAPNLSQIIEAIGRDGYVVTQEYLPEAKNGDIRMFVMNGRPLEVDGQIAAFRRVSTSDDIRSNMSTGGKAQKVNVTPEMLEMVEAVRPKLIADGMFLVGLDIVGDKLMEVNVFSPGGFGSCEALYGIDFVPAVIDDLERKVSVRKHYDEIPNVRLATL